MRKKLMMVSMCLLAFAAVAESEIVDGVQWFYTKTGSGSNAAALINSGSPKYTGDLTVPSTLGGLPVTGIAGSAFENCTGLTSVKIPEGVTSIAYGAFSGCSALTSVTLPQSLLTVDNAAFIYCTSLETVTIPSNVISIGLDAFTFTPFLDKQPNGFVVLGKVLLLYKGDCPASVTIPSGIVSVGCAAFRGCYTLSSVTIPEGVESIGESAFEGCDTLSDLKLPATLTEIGPMAFAGCSSLLEVTIPSGVEFLGYSSFSMCENLTTVNLPAGLKRIESGTFAMCMSLASLSIPEGVNYIGDMAFEETPFYDSFPDGFVILGKVLYAFKGECPSTVVIPNGIETIAFDAFLDRAEITSVTIPESVTTICGQAFAGCTGLTSLDLPSGLKTLEASAFGGSGLTSMTIPDGVQSIPSYLFWGCSSLKTVTIPDGVDTIPAWTFGYCTSLESIRIPGSAKGIGREAFMQCTSLKTVTLCEGVESIGMYAFSGCSSLVKIEIPMSLTKFESTAFGNSGLTYAYMIVPPSHPCFSYENGSFIDLRTGKTLFTTPEPVVSVISTRVRETDPTILDVSYVVKGAFDKIKVRALAFEDGEISWAKVVRPETFVANPDGSVSEIGGSYTAFDTHSFAWRVSADYTGTLAKFKIVVYAEPDDLLPMEFMQIPACNGQPHLEFSYNTLQNSSVENALYWLYADKNENLSLADGQLKDGSTVLANGTALIFGKAAEFVINKMGYKKLSSENYLDHVNAETRLGLKPSGIKQYAVKELD